ncbi:hypothetical protein GGP52_003052 [Salinibacter ruber]|nr:hypothetical protein [Salinibacter ruber]
MQTVELVSENASTGSFEPVDYLVGSMACVCLNEEVDMIRPNRQGIDPPIVFFGDPTEHLLQAVSHFAFKHTRTSLRTPHEVVLHRVDGVTASAIWFFVD